ncbi:hypothetical protein WJX73_001033 [Symbiochloris irregularis]|uniref:MYND-type domain-containing protein n=1 Tax=Symbiochloris irregularis TaxID=706552 RepID=A0AAW1NZS1_9CHLO
MEVQYACHAGSEHFFENWAALDTPTSNRDHILVFTLTVLEAKLIREVLLANAAELDTGYKQRRMRQWGLEGTSFAVSFIAPAGLLTAKQTHSLQAQCANPSCRQPALSKCSRCQAVSYCGKACQKSNTDGLLAVLTALPNVHGTDRFVVRAVSSEDKAQPCLIRDHDSFAVLVLPSDQPAHRVLQDIVKRKGHFKDGKTFLNLWQGGANTAAGTRTIECVMAMQRRSEFAEKQNALLCAAVSFLLPCCCGQS